MPFSRKLLDHFNNPRNVGSLPKDDPAVGTAMVGSPDCGDLMKLQIRVDAATNRIDEVRFKTYGCGSAIASSSLVSEWLKGRTLDEALAIRHTDIVEELSLPPAKLHCAVLAEDAIRSAVADYGRQQARRAPAPACGPGPRSSAAGVKWDEGV